MQHIDTLPKYGKKLSIYVGPRNVYPTIYVSYICKPFFLKKLKGLSTIVSFQTVFCYQYVELSNHYSAQGCVISPNFRRYHMGFNFAWLNI